MHQQGQHGRALVANQQQQNSKVLARCARTGDAGQADPKNDTAVKNGGIDGRAQINAQQVPEPSGPDHHDCPQQQGAGHTDPERLAHLGLIKKMHVFGHLLCLR